MIELGNDCFSEIDVFKKVISLEVAPLNPGLCKFSMELTNSLPRYFWIESASSSGKYHPQYALGDGGLARHSLMTYRWLMSLIETQKSSVVEPISKFIPAMVVACLLHDCCKRGLPDSISTEHTVHEHPILAAKWIIDKSRKFIDENNDFIELVGDDSDSIKEDIAVIASCVQTHMGKWSFSPKSSVKLPEPNDLIQQLVHLSDYCASRKFTTFDYEYFNDLMNK